MTATGDSSATTKGNHAIASIRTLDDPLQPKNTRSPKPFVTKEALARRYGVCDRTIEKWMKAGILIFLKVKRVVRFHVEGCDEALRKRGFLS